MLNLKKTAVAVLALGSSAVFAGTMGPVCTPGSVTVPCERSAWDFGGQALYLQATGEDYAFADAAAATPLVGNSRNQWGWGFQIEGSYHFGTGNDVNVNWYHLDRNRHNNFTVVAAGVPVVTGTLNLKPKWDAVNFEFGQMVNFGERERIRFHGGAQYVDLKRNAYGVIGAATTGSLNQKYSAFGPRLGADMAYELANGFSVYGKGATAVLVGKSKFNVTAATITGGVVTVATPVSGSPDMVVPEIEAKLGVKYNYAMAQGDLILDAGYMWVDYINVHSNPFATTTLGGRSDFGLDGVYFGAKWVGNVV